MDEVLDKLETTVITPEQNDYQALYKNWGRLGNQEERRKEILELQKTNRKDKVDAFRGILELVKEVEEKNLFKPYNPVHYRPSIYVAGFNKASVTYNNVLMLSEWMIEKPVDFSENWFVVPCPKGVRMLIVAHMGKTRAYTKFGQFKMMFRSALPGGNPCDYQKNRCCVLDCFYSEKKKILYILDVLAWNSQPMTDGEMEFRQFWIQSKLIDIPELTTISKKNQIIFQLLPAVPCSADSFNNFMMTYPHFEENDPSLDGLLFYHKRAHYVSGETPLVGWLFPYMVQEIIGPEVTVHQEYMNATPAGYVNQAQFIQAFEAKMDKRKSRGRRSNVMDTSDSTQTEPKQNTKTENEPADTEQMEAEDKTDSTKRNGSNEATQMDSETKPKSDNDFKLENTENMVEEVISDADNNNKNTE